MLIPIVDYLYSKYKGVHTLKNLSNKPFTYVISIVKPYTSTILTTKTILPGVTEVLLKGLLDGEYKISLIDEQNRVAEITILHYEKLLFQVITSINNLVCKVCQDCKESQKCTKCEDYLNSLILAESYYHLNYSTYNSYMSNINNVLVSSLRSSITIYINEIIIKGKGNSENIILKLLGMYYIVFYYTDLSLSTNIAETEYINLKYKAENTLGCLRDLGINVGSGEQVVDTNINVYFWQLSNSLDTINTVIPLLNNVFINSKAMYSLEEFEVGKTISYNNVARIAFVLKEVSTTSFAIYDALNNNVTAQFDVYYDLNIKSLLYVSKVNYSFSNIFFKIKNLIVT
jgi:hypothetical protein